MKIFAIICEYNPFHNGHLYQINTIKKNHPDSIIIALMSGNFTQRGEIAIFDKYRRAKAAITYGCDIVLELPPNIATSSAGLFASGAIDILNSLNIVNYLCFGSEVSDENLLLAIADNLTSDEIFVNEIKPYLSKGYNYFSARNLYLSNKFNIDVGTMNNSNVILAVEYLISLLKSNSHIKPFIIKRKGEDFNSLNTSTLSSASAIRYAVKNDINISSAIPDYDLNYPLFSNDFFDELIHSIYLKVKPTTDFNRRLLNTYMDVSSYDELVENLNHRATCKSSVQRSLLHILLNITNDIPNFVNVLASKKEYLHILSKSSINIIKNSKDMKQLNKKDRDILNNFIEADGVYYKKLSTKYDKNLKFRRFFGIITS